MTSKAAKRPARRENRRIERALAADIDLPAIAYWAPPRKRRRRREHKARHR